MNQLEKRIRRLESLYLPDESTGFLWPEIKFLCEFPKVFPDPNLAPPLARRAYFRIEARWNRFAAATVLADESVEDSGD